jgi:hypothetical protein
VAAPTRRRLDGCAAVFLVHCCSANFVCAFCSPAPAATQQTQTKKGAWDCDTNAEIPADKEVGVEGGGVGGLTHAHDGRRMRAAATCKR